MKYIKPLSLTWWSSVVPLCAGIAVVTVPWHGSQTSVDLINAISQDWPPSMMINFGLVGIGLRGAVGP